jgi:hypothetical protein
MGGCLTKDRPCPARSPRAPPPSQDPTQHPPVVAPPNATDQGIANLGEHARGFPSRAQQQLRYSTPNAARPSETEQQAPILPPPDLTTQERQELMRLSRRSCDRRRQQPAQPHPPSRASLDFERLMREEFDEEELYVLTQLTRQASGGDGSAAAGGGAQRRSRLRSGEPIMLPDLAPSLPVASRFLVERERQRQQQRERRSLRPNSNHVVSAPRRGTDHWEEPINTSSSSVSGSEPSTSGLGLDARNLSSSNEWYGLMSGLPRQSSGGYGNSSSNASTPRAGSGGSGGSSNRSGRSGRSSGK